jgi:hypothetical protein
MRKRKSTPRFKASDLLLQEKTLRKIRKKNYVIQLDKCINSIRTVNDRCHLMYTTYTVPSMLPGEPYYDMDECIIYLKEELRKSEFYVRLMKPGNVLYISWKPEDIEKVKRHNARVERKERRHRDDPEERQMPAVLDIDPDSALDNVRLRTTLMMNNPKYSHLPSVQKLKRRKLHEN